MPEPEQKPAPRIRGGGDLLKQARKAAGLSAYDVNQKAGVREQYVYQLEAPPNPKNSLPNPMRRYAEVFNSSDPNWGTSAARQIYHELGRRLFEDTADPVERFILAHSLLRELELTAARPAIEEAAQVDTSSLADMAKGAPADIRDPAKIGRRPRSSEERATVLDRARTLGFRVVQGVWEKKPQGGLATFAS